MGCGFPSWECLLSLLSASSMCISNQLLYPLILPREAPFYYWENNLLLQLICLLNLILSHWKWKVETFLQLEQSVLCSPSHQHFSMYTSIRKCCDLPRNWIKTHYCWQKRRKPFICGLIVTAKSHNHKIPEVLVSELENLLGTTVILSGILTLVYLLSPGCGDTSGEKPFYFPTH